MKKCGSLGLGWPRDLKLRLSFKKNEIFKLKRIETPNSNDVQKLTAYKPIPGELPRCGLGISNIDIINLNSQFRSQKGFPIWSGIGT